jgi:ubiquinol-cytochrome c reductase cytochrome c1 subunit
MIGKNIKLGFILAVLAAPAFASGGAEHPKEMSWSFSGAFGTFDRAAVQRGFQVYKEVCSSCHAMNLMSYRNLGQKDGPFEYVKMGDELKHFANPNENPVVKAIAAEYKVADTDDNGDPIERTATPADHFVAPFANEKAARASNGGAYPPDLSLIIKARHDGPNYVYSLITGYATPPAGLEVPDGKHYNPYFPGDLTSAWKGSGHAPKGGFIAMPPPIAADQVTYSDGTKATQAQIAHDVVTFLAWAAEPKMEERKRIGFMVLCFLGVLSLLLYGSYRTLWRNIEH